MGKPLTPISIDGQMLMGKTEGLTFPDAIRELTKGKKIARMAWGANDSYGLLKDGFLMIFIDKEFKKWLVNDGDLTSSDWVVLSDLN